MCARLLACPLCSQPGFLTLDALRAGLVRVATRPLVCPVCNEVLLGIDKLTIHLFGHSINPNNVVNAVDGATGNEATKIIEVTSNGNVQAIVRNAQTIPLQSWNVMNAAQTIGDGKGQLEEAARENQGSGIYIPIDEIETFRSALKDGNNVIPVNNAQNITEVKGTSQVIFLQNVATQPKIFSANLIGQTTDSEPISTSLFQAAPVVASAISSTAAETETQMDQSCRQETNANAMNKNEMVVQNGNTSNTTADKSKELFPQNAWTDSVSSEPAVKFGPSHTDRLADLVKNAQITASPLGNFHESFDCSKPESPPPKSKPIIKSTRIITPSEKTERCNICGFHFPDKNILLLHKQLVHRIQAQDSNKAPEALMKNFPCHLCTKVFKMKGSLMVHMMVAHPGFNSSGSIKEIMQQKEQEKKLQQQKEKQNELQKEIEPVSYNEPEAGYNCPTCGKNFKKEQHVMQHLKIHEGKQWECDVCSKMFSTKYFLKKHKRLHSGEMPYKCNICDKTFTFQQSYHKHRLYHKDDKPHTCNTCGRSFKELSTLHNHERIHTGEKPFACETCGKCFRQRVSYLVHRRIHTGVMPYKCTTCGKTFRYKVSQRTHKCPLHPENQELQQSGNLNRNLLESTEMNDLHESSSQEEKYMNEPTVNDENQYVLILNNEGQHVLKKKSDVDNENKQKNNQNIGNERNKEDTSSSSDFMQHLWNQESFDQMEYKENSSKKDDMVSNVINDSNLWNGISNNKNNSPTNSNDLIKKQFNVKELSSEFTNSPWNMDNTLNNEITNEKACNDNQTKSPRDFFSLVLSPLENGLPSPSTEMQHLRLSSPINNQENRSEANDCFPPMNSSVNPVQVDHNTEEENFTENNLSTLQTINEDSLKELLYSITDK